MAPPNFLDGEKTPYCIPAKQSHGQVSSQWDCITDRWWCLPGNKENSYRERGLKPVLMERKRKREEFSVAQSGFRIASHLDRMMWKIRCVFAVPYNNNNKQLEYIASIASPSTWRTGCWLFCGWLIFYSLASSTKVGLM